MPGNTDLRCADGGWRAGAPVRAAAAVHVIAFARNGFAVAGKVDAASVAGNGRVNENIQF